MKFDGFTVGGLYAIIDICDESLKEIWPEEYIKRKEAVSSFSKNFSSYRKLDESIIFYFNLFPNIDDIVNTRRVSCGYIEKCIPFLILEDCGKYTIKDKPYRIMYVMQTRDEESDMGYFGFTEGNLDSESINPGVYEIYELHI